MNCEFCAALTGRFDANRECCQIRLLAGAPAHTRRDVYARVKKDDGDEELAQIKQKVRTEYQRQQDHKAAIAREQRAQEAVKGRAQSAALLMKMKEELNMNVPSLERDAAAAATPAPAKEFA